MTTELASRSDPPHVGDQRSGRACSRICAAMAIVFEVFVVSTAPAAGAGPPTVTDAAVCNEEARKRTGPPTGPPRTLTPAPGTRTDRSGSIIADAPDPLLEGMAAAGLDDIEYRNAYRACMAARGERAR